MQLNTYNPAFKERVQEYFEKQAFMRLIGFELDGIEVGMTSGWLDLKPHHKQQKGLVHGGLVCTLADVVSGFAAYTLVHSNHNVVTGEIKVSCLLPGVGERLLARGWVLKQGKKLNFCEAEIHCLNGNEKRLIAKATATMVTLFPADLKPVA